MTDEDTGPVTLELPSRAKVWLKVAVAVAFALLYGVSPIDLIPDFIVGFGQLDDLGVAGAVLWYVFHLWQQLKASRRTDFPL